MSDVHWIIRVAAFGGLTYICVKIAQFVTWLCSFQWWIYLIALAVIVNIIVLVHWLRYNYQVRKHTTIIIPNQQYTIGNKPEINTIEESILTKNKVKVYDRYRCPRCNSKLVKRYGPYGNFYGCESYGQTGCRYINKYL